MTIRVPKFFKSLSARLLLLTLLWVSFIVSSIGYTMYLNWQLEASAAAKFTAAEIRNSVFRAALFAQSGYSQKEFDTEVSMLNRRFALLKHGDRWQPLQLPQTESIQESLARIESEWRKTLYPLLAEAKSKGELIRMARINAFAEEISLFTEEIDTTRSALLWQLRYLQALLIVLAVGSLFTIIALLLRWVIRPLERLGEGINKLSSGDLSARVENKTEDEIGAIVAGFNRMAERLEDLYNNLEQKVADKTASVEEKNRHLAQLYEITSFFSRSRPLQEMTDGFVDRITRYAEADACAVCLVDKGMEYEAIAASYGLSASLLQTIEVGHLERDLCAAVLEKTYPVSLRFDAVKDAEKPLEKLFLEAGFTTAYCFQVRSTSDNMGIYMLLYKEDPVLSSQMVQLLESFSMHLGVAIDNMRLIERERQFAVVQERQLLAQGLHDSIAQALSFLNLQVQFLSDAIAHNDEALRDEALSAIRTGVQECYEDVRELLLNFRERIHKEGFIDGVKTVIDRFEGQAHVSARLQVIGKGVELTERQKLQVIFIIQEALSNIRKHAEAENVDITIENADDLKVSIVDDGIGIDDKLVAKRKGQHVGLSIMAERAARIGATVNVVKASPIGGTRVTLVLPASVRGLS